MSLQDEITRAIGAHGMWKTRLMMAIESGSSEFDPIKVCQDNQCDFGHWLHGATLQATDKANPNYEVVRKLHTEFHKLTGEILRLALAGKKQEALAQMAMGSRYATLSGELTKAMMKWKG